MTPTLGGTLGLVAMVGLPAVALVVGVALLRRGYRTRRLASALSETDPSTVADLSRGDYAVVAGRAHPADEGTIEATILDEEALVVETAVESVNRRAGDTAGTRTTDHRSTDAVPFVVDDGTGRVRVELPGDATVRLRKRTDLKVSHAAKAASKPGEFGDDVPEGVREYVRTHDTAATYTRWYRQGAVRPGDHVHVAGPVTDGPAGFDDPEVTIAGGSDPGLVAAWNHDETVSGPGAEWAFLVLFGGVLSAVGVLTGAVVVGTLVL